MFRWIQDLFPKPEPQYKIVELTEPRTLSQLGDSEMRESIYTLASHPGFVSLMNKLAYQSQSLKTKLAHERHADLRSVDFLQAGIYWSNWLRQELTRVTTKLPERQLDPMEEELRAFKEIDATIERIS